MEMEVKYHVNGDWQWDKNGKRDILCMVKMGIPRWKKKIKYEEEEGDSSRISTYKISVDIYKIKFVILNPDPSLN